jgi:hypothetical protein
MNDHSMNRDRRFFFMPDEPPAEGLSAPAPADLEPPKEQNNSENAAQRLLKKTQEELAATKLELQKVKDAELSELERLKKHSAELEERVRSTERDNLKRKVAQEENVPVEGLEYLAGDDESTLRQNAQKLVTLIGSKASAAAGSRTQPAGNQAPTIDEQISAAERSGNRALSISLKNQKMRGS